MNKSNLHATILLGSFILGSFVFISQAYKQSSIEKQQQLKLDAENANAVAKNLGLSNCLNNAEDNYQTNFESYCISENKGNSCQSIKTYHAIDVRNILKEEKEDCFKQYK